MTAAADTLVVVNPASGGGRTAAAWPAVESALTCAGVAYELRMTAGRGEATVLTRAALGAGTRRVVVCGGDGTLNEVVDGFFDAAGAPIAPGAALGLLPSGTGDDFRKSAAIPRQPDAAAALIASGVTRTIDAARITYADASTRCFVNIADCGMGGEVARLVNAARRRPRGRLPYVRAQIRTLLTYPPVHARIEVDGVAFECSARWIAIANGRYFGGGTQIAPAADLADGTLDVVLGHAGLVRSLVDARHYRDGTHVGRPGVFATRGRSIRVTSLDGRPMPFDVDGELVGAAPATIDVLPGALELCAPPAPAS